MNSGAIISKKLDDTRAAAQSVLEGFSKCAGATILALSGDLGSGKTAFTKEFANLLGIPKGEITSPTFVIMKIFDLPAGKAGFEGSQFLHLIHIDAYRLERESELVNLGWNKIITDPKNLIVIEWPERVKGLIPNNAVTISFRHVDEETREISIKQ